jgi:hypothetical protein
MAAFLLIALTPTAMPGCLSELAKMAGKICPNWHIERDRGQQQSRPPLKLGHRGL